MLTIFPLGSINGTLKSFNRDRPKANNYPIVPAARIIFIVRTDCRHWLICRLLGDGGNPDATIVFKFFFVDLPWCTCILPELEYGLAAAASFVAAYLSVGAFTYAVVVGGEIPEDRWGFGWYCLTLVCEEQVSLW